MELGPYLSPNISKSEKWVLIAHTSGLSWMMPFLPLRIRSAHLRIANFNFCVVLSMREKQFLARPGLLESKKKIGDNRAVFQFGK